MSDEFQSAMAGQGSYGLYYQHSGRVPLAGVIITAIAGIVTALVGAAAYAYLDLYIPIVYANVLGTAAFGALIGFVTGRAAKMGKIRSAPVAFALVTVAALIGYYACWVFWIYAAVQRFFPDNDLMFKELIQSPSELWHGVKVFNESGTWAIGHGSSASGGNVSGIFLSLIWIAEVVTIFVTAYALAAVSIKSEMFCELCGRWCGPAKRIRQTGPGDADSVRRQLETHNFASLDTLAPPDSRRFWDIEYSRCSSCDKLHALTITDTSISMNKKGESKTTKKVIVNRLLLDPAEAAAVTAPRVATVVNNTPTEPDASV